MTTHLDTNLPRAHSVGSGVCGCCGSVILTMIGKDGVPFAWASIEADVWLNISTKVDEDILRWIERREPAAGEMQ